MRTYNAKPDEVDRRWFVVDAAEEPLGRTASRVAE
ncbi:MAG: 50S ribosomal protein L13, partial [Polyangia bacterium]